MKPGSKFFFLIGILLTPFLALQLFDVIALEEKVYHMLGLVCFVSYLIGFALIRIEQKKENLKEFI